MSIYRHSINRLTTRYPLGEAQALVRLFMEERFGLTHTDLLVGKDKDLSANDCTEAENIVERLLKSEPIQYILGHTTFCGLDLEVAPGVLIPRPETAELIDWIVSEHTPCRVLDIGTGSGCIALALASKGFTVEAWDVSPQALAIAQRNAQRLQLPVQFRQVDVLHIPHEYLEESLQYDLIVSNPPYICRHEAKEMEDNVLQHEPHIALFVPDEDPLLFYRAIARFAAAHLNPQGALYYEINRAYADETCHLLNNEGFSHTEVRLDAYQNPRMVRGLKNACCK